MRQRPQHKKRRGATLLEAAFAVPVVLTLALGALDLGAAIARQNTLSYAARQLTRQAITHGSLAPSPVGTWGPATYGPAPGDAADPIPQSLRQYLPGVDPSQVTLTVAWPDGSNEPGNRVTVTLSCPYRPMTTFVFGNPTWTLAATSTRTIAH